MRQERQCSMEEMEMMCSVSMPPNACSRSIYILSIALVAGLGAVAHAQLPLPLEPDPGKLLQCARDYVQSVRRLGEALEKLRTAGPEAIGRTCTMIETGSAWFGGKLPDAVRQE